MAQDQGKETVIAMLATKESFVTFVQKIITRRARMILIQFVKVVVIIIIFYKETS